MCTQRERERENSTMRPASLLGSGLVRHMGKEKQIHPPSHSPSQNLPRPPKGEGRRRKRWQQSQYLWSGWGGREEGGRTGNERRGPPQRASQSIAERQSDSPTFLIFLLGISFEILRFFSILYVINYALFPMRFLLATGEGESLFRGLHLRRRFR